MSQNDVEEPEIGNNHYSKVIQSQFVGQWITSLAISVVCCAILFVVFAGYMVRLHEKTNLADLRIELLQEKHTQIMTEIATLRRQQPQTIFNLQGVSPVNVTPQQPQQEVEQPVEPPAPAGVNIDEAGGKVEGESNPVDSGLAPEPVPAPPHIAPDRATKPKIDLGVPEFTPPASVAPIVR